MTRYEFTERLRTALQGEIPASVVEENIRFYDRYISDEIAEGKSEEEVLSELGDARLIAKTILETWQSDDTDLGGDHTTRVYEGSREETYEEDGSHRSQQSDGSFFGMNGKVYRLDKWYLKLIPIAIVLLILAVVFLAFFGVIKLSIAILTSPVFWGVILVVAVLRWFLGRR